MKRDDVLRENMYQLKSYVQKMKDPVKIIHVRSTLTRHGLVVGSVHLKISRYSSDGRKV